MLPHDVSLEASDYVLIEMSALLGWFAQTAPLRVCLFVPNVSLWNLYKTKRLVQKNQFEILFSLQHIRTQHVRARTFHTYWSTQVQSCQNLGGEKHFSLARAMARYTMLSRQTTAKQQFSCSIAINSRDTRLKLYTLIVLYKFYNWSKFGAFPSFCSVATAQVYFLSKIRITLRKIVCSTSKFVY